MNSNKTPKGVFLGLNERKWLHVTDIMPIIALSKRNNDLKGK
ncbi:hypothetical protein VPHK567_0152 [Vibrio phage K567]